MAEYQKDKYSIICLESTDPSLNLATEQYLLKEKSENFILLWRNKRAIITGKHQVSYKEVNYPFCVENDIAVHRRLSGGGTVFHDLGNLNFTIIENRPDKNRLIDFPRYLQPIANFLNDLGVPAELSQRNDLFVDGYKISGNAQHVEQKLQRVIHHGTLLFDADLESLRSGLRPSGVEYETKGVDSVRSKVKNITELYELDMNMDGFIQNLTRFYQETYSAKELILSNHDMERINEISSEKYSTWDWNIGYSPKYTAHVHEYGISFFVKNGIIEEIDSENEVSLNKFSPLKGSMHEPFTIQQLDIDVDWRTLF